MKLARTFAGVWSFLSMPTSISSPSFSVLSSSSASLRSSPDCSSSPPNTAITRVHVLRIVPFVPEAILRQHHVFVPSDNRFTAACRLLAALWRHDQGLPCGIHTPGPRRRAGEASSTALLPKAVRLGSRLAPAAARAGATFLTPEIGSYAREVLLFREPGSLWEEGRLWGNLLSSQAMTLNLLAPMARDLDLATAVWRLLLAGFVHTVTALRFEHSPGRRGPDYFGDGTAFDVLLDVVTPDGEPAFVAVEVKYVEGMNGPTPPPRPCYAETTRASGLFVEPDAAVLLQPGYEQLRREHVLTQLMVQQGLAARAHFVLLGPALNRRVHAVGKLYANELRPIDTAAEVDRVGFSALTLEAVVAALAAAGATELAASFTARYLDLTRVVHCVLDQTPSELQPRRSGRRPSSVLPTPSATSATAAARVTTSVQQRPYKLSSGRTRGVVPAPVKP
ncbi:hypothetical protein [Methylobacterium sp. Leaf88]|uniref:PGN_0703 family putative restriction endonuclease n=1 Tax=Methylobacterium sp. Leaf88 TaxID=1736244 RepID=UPI000B1A7685|nr:hypothetical protein [Methylobacterium sp. Leaf88]